MEVFKAFICLLKTFSFYSFLVLKVFSFMIFLNIKPKSLNFLLNAQKIFPTTFLAEMMNNQNNKVIQQFLCFSKNENFKN
jgi:hypothetical protein